MISSKKYAKKIVSVAYYKFPLVPPKDNVINATTALIDEYANQLVVQKQSEIDELVEFIDDICYELDTDEYDTAQSLIQKHTNK